MEEEDFICQEEFNNIMNDYENEMTKIRDEENRINNRILKAILNVKGKEFYDSLMSVIKEDECGDKFEIVRKPIGEYQKENFGVIKGIWVNQHSSGDSGDSFYGCVEVKIKKDRWIRMPFSC